MRLFSQAELRGLTTLALSSQSVLWMSCVEAFVSFCCTHLIRFHITYTPTWNSVSLRSKGPFLTDSAGPASWMKQQLLLILLLLLLLLGKARNSRLFERLTAGR
ncbi:hypothetical protein J3F83DRAFT_545765 [Trichoderma novae-zelandiae]